MEHLILRQTKEIPEEILTLVGDAVHNIRSALDHLVCALARLNGTNNVNDIHFPFNKIANEFPARHAKETKKLRSRDADLIAALKPYPGGNDLLYAVHEVDISDKHRALVAMGCLIPMIDWTFRVQPPTHKIYSMPMNPMQALNNGEPLLIFEAGSKVEYDFKIGGDIAFAEPHSIKGKSALATLNEMRQLVENIVLQFERLY